MLDSKASTSDCAHGSSPKAKLGILVDMFFDVFNNCFEVFSLVESYSLHLASHTQRHVLPLREARTTEVEHQIAEIILNSKPKVGKTFVITKVPSNLHPELQCR